MGNPILVGFKRITDTVAGLIARDTSGNEFTICDTDGYLYQNDTKVTETASNINAVGDLITEVQTARGGEADLNTRLGVVDAQLAQKANKAQEAWIAPTLLNGWTDGASPIRYMKDEFGFVHFKGRATSPGVSGIVFSLPTGYKLSAVQYFAGATGSSATSFSRVDILGVVTCYVTTGFVDLSGIHFKAEA